MAQDTLIWLQGWYGAQVNGDWEHQYGVKIDTLDNPGWSVQIDLIGTALECKPFAGIEIKLSESDWLNCRVVSGKFEGGGDLGKLVAILETFRNWSTQRE